MEAAFGLEMPRTLEEVSDPRRLVLTVYDMQIGVLGQIKDADAIAKRVFEVLDAARSAGVRVVFLRHLSMPKELMGVFQLRMAMAWQRVDSVAAVNPWFLRDSPGFHLIPELVPQATEAVFDKITMSAFEGTPVDIVLRDCGINASPSWASLLRSASNRRCVTARISATFPLWSPTPAVPVTRKLPAARSTA